MYMRITFKPKEHDTRVVRGVLLLVDEDDDLGSISFDEIMDTSTDLQHHLNVTYREGHLYVSWPRSITNCPYGEITLTPNRLSCKPRGKYKHYSTSTHARDLLIGSVKSGELKFTKQEALEEWLQCSYPEGTLELLGTDDIVQLLEKHLTPQHAQEIVQRLIQ